MSDLNNQDSPEQDLGTRVGILAERKGGSDFLIEPDEKQKNMINLIGIESPGMTSCLAIADYVMGILR